MIILDDEAIPVSERTPLKGPMSPTVASSEFSAAPPPPYTAAPGAPAAAGGTGTIPPPPLVIAGGSLTPSQNGVNYQAIRTPYPNGSLPPPAHGRPVVQYRSSPLKRLLKAYLVALLVMLLWGVLMESIFGTAHGGVGHRVGDGKHDSGKFPRKGWTSYAMSFVIRSWDLTVVEDIRPTVPDDCPCRNVTLPMPGRVLPIAYPPIIPVTHDASESTTESQPQDEIPCPLSEAVVATPTTSIGLN